MKRIIASVGMAAIGAASIQSVQGQVGASASVRGFYDDNINTQPGGPNKKDSFGFDVSPTLSYTNTSLATTTFIGTYSYGFKYYDKKLNERDGHDDQTHTFGAQLQHAFNDRYRVSVEDSFVIGQEPDMLRVGSDRAYDTLQRISGDNIRNYGSIIFNGDITPIFGIEVGYNNSLTDYDDANIYAASILDRIEHRAHVDSRWTIRQDITYGIVGYEYGQVDFTFGRVDLNAVGLGVVNTDRLNSRSHAGYVGLEHHFLPELFGSIKAGVRYNDYYNSPDKATSLTPYVQAGLQYTYAQGVLALSVMHDQSANSQLNMPAGNSITHDMESTTVSSSLTHWFTQSRSLSGSIIGNFQNSTYNGGSLDGGSQDFYVVGVNLEYFPPCWNRHVSFTAGYNFDRGETDVQYPPSLNRSRISFDRNRVYLGVTLVY